MPKHIKKIIILDHDELDYIILGEIGPELAVCPLKGYLKEN